MNKLIAALFFLISPLALAMDSEDKTRVQSAPPQRMILESIPADVFQTCIFTRLDVPSFFAFMQTCQLVHQIASHPNLYLSADPHVLLQQLPAFVSREGKINWSDLLTRAARTRGADLHLFQASKLCPEGIEEPDKVVFNDAWKQLYGPALFLAAFMGEKKAIHHHEMIANHHEEHPTLPADKIALYFLSTLPKRHFKANQQKAYQLIFETMKFGQAWNLSVENRYWDYAFSDSLVGQSSKFEYATLNELNYVLKLGDKHSQPEDPKREIWSLFYDTYLDIYQRHLYGILDFWRKKKAQLAALEKDPATPQEKILALQDKENMYRIWLNKVSDEIYKNPYWLFNHEAFKARKLSFLLDMTNFYHEIGEKKKEASAYADVGTYTAENNKTEALSFTLKAIALFEELGEKTWVTALYISAASLVDDPVQKQKYLSKIASAEEKE